MLNIDDYNSYGKFKDKEDDTSSVLHDQVIN